jgi:hypothetical protein
MKITSLQARLWHLLLINGVLGAVIGVARLDIAGTCALFVMASTILIPVCAARPERRLKVAAWIVSLHPVMTLPYVYAAWGVAWCLLGHRPRSSLDDPYRIGFPVEVPLVLAHFAFGGWSFSICAGLVLAGRRWLLRRDLGELGALPVAWIVTFVLLVWDPMGVLEWALD